MKKFIRIGTGSHAEPKCPNKKCTGVALVPVDPITKAVIRSGENYNAGEIKFTCNHVHQVIVEN